MTFQLIFFLLSISTAPVESQIFLSTESLRQGDPAFAVYLAHPDGSPVISQARSQANGLDAYAGFKAVIHYATGGSTPGFTGLPLPGSSTLAAAKLLDYATIEGFALPVHARADIALGAVMFLLGVPVDAPVGPAVIVIVGPGGNPVAELITEVSRTEFRRDDIRLDKDLTSLRVDKNPQKDEQARRYLALLGTTTPGRVFMDQGFLRPVTGERRTSLFGDIRRYIYADDGIDWSIHNGVDYGYPTGTPVLAAGRGRVALVEDRIVTGNTVVIEHLPGVYTIYMHLHQMAVRAGDMVEREQVIGTIGATGLATGPHLHWELRISGIPCDPETLAGLDKMPRIRTMTLAIEGR